jgi:hypothetical protein
MGSSIQPIFSSFAQTRKWKVAFHLVRQKLWKRRVPVDTEHAWLLRVPGAFFGIYLGRGGPSRSQVFTLELFPGGRPSGSYSACGRVLSRLATRSRVRKVVLDTGASDFAECTAAALARGVLSQGPVTAMSCAGDLMQSNPIILRISIDSKRSALRASLLEVSRPF